MGTQVRVCGSCGGEQPFETPPCPDGHGADCPERVCTRCGAAVLVDPPQSRLGDADLSAQTTHAA